jgi:basic amino acid/polyamine antiporter, APA family
MSDPQGATSHYLSRLGVFDTTMVVVGGIIGAGIFLNPAIVAQRVHSTAFILTTWVLGGVIAPTARRAIHSCRRCSSSLQCLSS